MRAEVKNYIENQIATWQNSLASSPLILQHALHGGLRKDGQATLLSQILLAMVKESTVWLGQSTLPAQSRFIRVSLVGLPTLFLQVAVHHFLNTNLKEKSENVSY